MFIASPFAISQKWKPSKCPSTDEWIHRVVSPYNGILLAEVPDNGNLEEIAEGNWIYWVEPQYASEFMKDNTEIFAEL